jgi:hypothetical protein
MLLIGREPPESPRRTSDVRIAAVSVVSLLLIAVSASAKEFPPGALKVCGATQCRVVTDTQSRASEPSFTAPAKRRLSGHRCNTRVRALLTGTPVAG